MVNLNNLQTLLNKNIISDIDTATLTKIYLVRDVEPRGIITARYELTVTHLDKNGKQPLFRHYVARKLRAMENPTYKESFVVYVKIGYKLPAIIDAVKLKQAFEKAPVFCAEHCIVDAFNAIQEANKAQWITQLKQAAKDKDGTKAAQIIRTILRPDFVTVKGDMQGIDWRFKEHHNTITKLCDGIGIAPHQNKQFLEDTIKAAHDYFISGYMVRMIDNPQEVSKIYAINYIESCMVGLETPAKIYAPYLDGKQSIALHVLEHDGDFVARFIVRLKSKKYPTAYSTLSSDKTDYILDALGYERNPSALIGGRLPLVTDTDNSIFMPYIDGTEKDIRLIESETGNYLQVGGTRGELVGDASGTRGKLKPNNYALELGFTYGDNQKEFSDYYNPQEDEDNHEEQFYCNHCEEWCDNDTHNHVNDESICDYCLNNSFTACEDCDTYILQDDANYIEVYNHQSDETESVTVCECCLNDNYFLEPVKNEYYFNIESLKRHVTG